MTRYEKKAQDTVKAVMAKRKAGTLRSGSGAKVTSRKQAMAIGLSEARKKGARVPPPKKNRAASKNISRKRTT